MRDKSAHIMPPFLGSPLLFHDQLAALPAQSTDVARSLRQVRSFIFGENHR
jgi:hypothetical protein